MNQKSIETPSRQVIEAWFRSKKWQPFNFQIQAWNAYAHGKDGLVNAPTGSGKTYSLLIPAIAPYIGLDTAPKGLRILWITPIRALAKEIYISASRFIDELDIPFEVMIRTGDTPTSERKKMQKDMPQLLITTPESLQVMISQKKHPAVFRNLESVVVDEWHELMGSKRGVLLELSLSRLTAVKKDIRIWGISATVGNLGEAAQVLLGQDRSKNSELIKARIKKEITVQSIIPEEMELMPWHGHLGIKLIDEVLPIIEKSRSTLIFTNTRAQCEIWYHRILIQSPELAGLIAMHHGSISKNLRHWVEDAIYDGRLKAVVCTSSLDLGVDFSPVETIIQVGGPKGVSRFIQRAGRSGHQPGAESKIFFLPTHSLELVEAAALRQAVKEQYVEERIPYVLSFDVLIQYLLTLAVSDGFEPDQTLKEVRSTHCYADITDEEWDWCLRFITTGGSSLGAYPEFMKVQVENGVYKIKSAFIARRHRLSIGTIVGDSLITVRYNRGSNLGNVEESFISRLNTGDTFWFAGRSLELIKIKEMVAYVQNSHKKTTKIPAYGGGRFPLTSKMSDMLRRKLTEAAKGEFRDVELIRLQPLLDLQKERSVIPNENQFLIEKFETNEGHHLIFFPFEGRLVHEGMAGLIAWRISQEMPVSFSLGFNDYGFELLSDQEIDIEGFLGDGLLSIDNLLGDLQAGINESEMARRKFRDIAIVSGLIFRGFPGMPVKGRHLQSSSGLLYKVFDEYDAHNLLFRQAHNEVIDQQLEMTRFRNAMNRILDQEIMITHPDVPTPFAFPIMAERIRGSLSSESVEQQLDKLSLRYT